ncbi:hypothetical protein [Staphylococcus delphini]|uniref:hypothetical protein n=1 Tax=Staphylococcus delphini TaxID=53344 RepID=UPI0023B3061E|nr:hypothetical protein [Staphylococcus delphini]MDE9751812.1 hypothetical protein [Staphylococcus delphini]MDE9789089.1 hypothetical protein [Staphylococcus delphini]MDE9791279.1 hypothetical protein [Staphylococcus delphini]MDE9793608.1 hypothetical protein [Staphylococcus delphini]MDE9796042.1 hypothetical protein [Staphylococcus delphini]
MEIKLKNLVVQFDLNSETPYFQVEDNYKIRWDIDSIQKRDLAEIMRLSFKSKINGSFLSKIISPVCKREVTRLGWYINIKNWRENIHFDNEKYIISSISDIDITEALNYCIYIKNSQIQPFIIFYDDTSLLKIGVDTIDIISASEELIKKLHTKFNF